MGIPYELSEDDRRTLIADRARDLSMATSADGEAGSREKIEGILGKIHQLAAGLPGGAQQAINERSTPLFSADGDLMFDAPRADAESTPGASGMSEVITPAMVDAAYWRIDENWVHANDANRELVRDVLNATLGIALGIKRK